MKRFSLIVIMLFLIQCQKVNDNQLEKWFLATSASNPKSNANANPNSDGSNPSSNSDKYYYSTRYMELNHYKTNCFKLFSSLCYLKKYDNIDEDWSLSSCFSFNDYQWGYQYNLKVEYKINKDPLDAPADGCLSSVNSIEILSKNKVEEGTTFSLKFSSAYSGQKIIYKLDNKYYLGYKIQIDCNTDSTCSSLDEFISTTSDSSNKNQNFEYLLTFKHSVNNTIVLSSLNKN